MLFRTRLFGAPRKRGRYLTVAGAVAGLLSLAATTAVAATTHEPSPEAQVAGRRPVTLEHLSAFVRWNANDNDAQIWGIVSDPDVAVSSISLYAPDGDKVFSEQLGSGRSDGQQKLEFRTSEHSPEELQELYPPGQYRWKGRTADGRRIAGASQITYDLPAAATITSPVDGSTDVPLTGVVVRWDPLADATMIFVEVESSDTIRELLVRLDGSATSFPVPDGYLEPGLEYEIEVKVVAPNGTQAARDSRFTTTATATAT